MVLDGSPPFGLEVPWEIEPREVIEYSMDGGYPFGAIGKTKDGKFIFPREYK